MKRLAVDSWSRVRAIVFDLDDTLYAQSDFKLSGFKAVSAWLAERGEGKHEALFSMMERSMHRLGPSHPHILDAVANELVLDDACVAEMVEVFRQHRPDIQVHHGVGSLLAELKGRYRLGLLTDGLARVQRNKVSALGLESVFDRTVFSDELGTCKPDPKLYEIFEKTFELGGCELVYVGDNPGKDFVTANQRGWLTLRVRTGEFGRLAAPSAGHDGTLSIDRLGDLLDMLPPVGVHGGTG